jgi:hypothetical protein
VHGDVRGPGTKEETVKRKAAYVRNGGRLMLLAAATALAAGVAASPCAAGGAPNQAAAEAEAGVAGAVLSDQFSAAASAAQAVAEEYLIARSRAVLTGAAAPAGGESGSTEDLSSAERLVARGKIACWRSSGERPAQVRCSVAVRSVDLDEAGTRAAVSAYAYTTVVLTGGPAGGREEGEGLGHTVTLELRDGVWVVVADEYLDTAQPSYLRAAGATQTVQRLAVRKLAEASRDRRLIALLSALTPRIRPPAARLAAARLITTLTYNRSAVVTYADKWTSESDVTGVSHNGARYNPAYYDYASNGGPGDCTPYASQCVRAGGYPFLKGWFYDFGNPFAASPSWYNNNPQRTYLNLRYIDKVSSVTDLKKGDLIYYDWDANGYLDHTAVYVGIYNGVRCIDAHTSDHRHHSWKLGGSGTKYHFYSVRDSIRWPLANQ